MKLADYVEQAKTFPENARRQGIREVLPQDPAKLCALILERPVELMHCGTRSGENLVAAMRRLLENYICRQLNPDSLWV